LRRKPDTVKLALAGREPQTQAVMCKPAGADVTQEARGSQVGSGSQGTAGQTVISRPAGAEVAQEARRSQVGSGRQGTADAGSHGQAGRVPQMQAVMSRPATADVAQEARRSHVGSGRQGNVDEGSHEQSGRGRRIRRKPEAVKLAL
jgi:hypothetical protein